MESTSSLSSVPVVNLPETQGTLPPALKFFADAFAFYKAHFAIIAAIGLVPIALGVLGTIAGIISAPASLILGLLSFVAGIFAWLAFFDLVRADGNPEGGTKGAYLRGRKMFAPYAIILLLQNLAVVGGAFLFIIPGVIFSILLGQAVYAYIFENKKGMDALITSWHYVRGRWWSVFWRIFFLGIIMWIISLIFFSVMGLGFGGGALLQIQGWEKIGENAALQQELTRSLEKTSRFADIASTILTYIFVLPFSVIYLSILYRVLQKTKSGVPLSEEEQVKMRKTLKILIAIAIVGIALLLIVFAFFFSWLLQYLLDPNADIPRGKNFMPPGFSAGISSLFNFC
ncbi:MAG: hypothetical protein HYT37_02155 [Candidatus Sungbacteria bacterium]|nr:hypothetical protein [Candidatus Sungbacteria bacterium]